MKKHIIFTIAILSTVTGIIYAEQWINPTQKPPYGNTAPPINTSLKPQVKEGGLSIGSLFTKGSAIFGNKVGIGTNTPSSPLEIAGKTEADAYCDRTGTKCIKIGDLLEEINGLKNKVVSNTTNISNISKNNTNDAVVDSVPSGTFCGAVFGGASKGETKSFTLGGKFFWGAGGIAQIPCNGHNIISGGAIGFNRPSCPAGYDLLSIDSGETYGCGKQQDSACSTFNLHCVKK